VRIPPGEYTAVATVDAGPLAGEMTAETTFTVE